ncbi:MAG: hypothetical protein J0L92_32955, partial [Deltaproteobacteria bacterium]|nr:hypothetical protein [Deltaproteobacteria bacterium]
MNDELMRKISDAIDSEDGLAGDPELIALMAKAPEASRYAKHLSRLQRWVAAWPVREPSEAEFEAMAKAIDARLGDKFSGDFTRAPDFEEDEEFARVSSAILQAADVESEPEHPMGDTSDALELTMSAITELADQVNEEASAVPLGRVPLKRGAGGIDPVVPQLATATLIDDLPAALPKAKPVVGLPKVPSPRAGAATVIGNPSGKADARDDAPAARIDADRGAPPAIKPAVPKPTEGKAEKPMALEPKVDPKPVPLEAKAPPKPPERAAADKPAVERPAPPVVEKATTEKAIAKDAKPPKPPEAKPAAKAEGKSASKTTDRVSIPVPSPSANAPRLELIEGGRSKAPPPPQEQRRGWLPAVLAAAAIAIGVIGVGSMMTSGGAAPSPET